MLPRPPPVSIVKLDHTNGVTWSNQIKNYIVLNGFDAVLTPVKRPAESWLDVLAPIASYSAGEIASGKPDATPHPPTVTQLSRPLDRLDDEVEEFLLNLCDVQTQISQSRRRQASTESSEETSDGVGGVDLSCSRWRSIRFCCGSRDFLNLAACCSWIFGSRDSSVWETAYGASHDIYCYYCGCCSGTI